MALQEPVHVLFMGDGQDARRTEPLLHYLTSTAHLDVTFRPEPGLPGDLSEFKMLILQDPAGLSDADQRHLSEFISKGGGCLGLVSSADGPLPEIFGAQTGDEGPYVELRIMRTEEKHPIWTRLPPVFFVKNQYLPLRPINGDTQSLLHTVWHFETMPMALLREAGQGRVACTTLTDYQNDSLTQYIYRIVRHVAGLGEPPPLGVGILGYSQHIGLMHGSAIQNTPGLEVRAAADLNPMQLEQAQGDFPGISTYQSSEALGKDPAVDVVIVVTPPNIHARLSIELLEAGKHVVVEKPMSITRAETDAMIAAANKNNRVLSVHQNRRWDVDFLAIRAAIRHGWIGEPFYLETFVGGYEHLCEHWHSHIPVSGGAMYDWGAHYIDWILHLFDEPTAAVIGTRHKRVWHDATNADQVRIQIRFEGGQEADFIHSDLAALRKPKWYLEGTQGTILGEWNDVTVHELDPVIYFTSEDIPATEMVPSLTMRRIDSQSGSLINQEVPLPERQRNPYHMDLANHLLTGEPLGVTPQSSARVVAVMEAATRSANNGGTVEELHV